MVPLIASIAANPVLAIDLSVIGPTKVHLVAIVALLTVLEAIVAVLAEFYFLARVELCLEEAGANRGC